MIKITCIYQIIDKFPIVGSLLNYFLKLNIFPDRFSQIENDDIFLVVAQISLLIEHINPLNIWSLGNTFTVPLKSAVFSRLFILYVLLKFYVIMYIHLNV